MTKRSKSVRLAPGLTDIDLFARNIMKPMFRLTNAEVRLAELLWIKTPIESVEMVKLAEQAFGWKKSVTFTVLKALIDKGLARKEKSRVTMLRTRDEIIAEQSNQAANSARGGCLPMFIVSCNQK